MSNEIYIALTKKLSEQFKMKKLDNIDIYGLNINMRHAGYKIIERSVDGNHIVTEILLPQKPRQCPRRLGRLSSSNRR